MKNFPKIKLESDMTSDETSTGRNKEEEAGRYNKKKVKKDLEQIDDPVQQDIIKVRTETYYEKKSKQ